MTGRFYFSRTPVNPPAWVGFVQPIVSTPIAGVLSASASGLLVVEASGRLFGVCFGYGRGLLNSAAIERLFGLKVALNRMDPSQIRSVDTKTFEDMVVTKNTHTSKSSELPSFGVDISRDILRAVTGKPRDSTFAKRVSGSDALVIAVDLQAHDLLKKCSELLSAFQETTYKTNFGWIDQLSLVNDTAVIGKLSQMVVAQLQSSDTGSTHMAMPEPIEWEDNDSFKIAGTKKLSYEDLDLDDYLFELGSDTKKLTIDLLKSRKVSVKFGRSGNYDARWTIYQCLVSEQRIGTDLFVLIEGRWFGVSDSLVKEVDAFATSVVDVAPRLPTSLPKETEPEYNKRVAGAEPDEYLLLDARINRPGGATTGIEFCDLLAADGTFIHIKRKSRSSTLSHLFSQGTVSAEAFLSDAPFRDAVRASIATLDGAKSRWLALVPSSAGLVRRQDHRVSYVVLADSSKPGVDWLPFFSKLNLMQHGRQLSTMGLEVSIARIGSV